MKASLDAYKRPVRKHVKPGRYYLPTLLKDCDMTISKGEGRRMIQNKGGLWLDRWDESQIGNLYGSTIYDRLEKIWPYLDNDEIELKENQTVCVGKTIDKAVCHRIVVR